MARMKEKAEGESPEIQEEQGKINLVYIGPTLNDIGLYFGKVYTYFPEYLVEIIPAIKNVLIPLEEFCKNKNLLYKKGSKYDVLIKEFMMKIKK